MHEEGWFEGVDGIESEAGSERIRHGSAETPGDWPTIAVESGAVPSADAYYETLHAAAMAALAAELEAVADAADVELMQLIRLHDTVVEQHNELRQRLLEAAGAIDPTGSPSTVEEISTLEDEGPVADHLVRVGDIVRTLDTERTSLEAAIGRTADEVVPNLADLLGPVLAARLVAAAGSLEALARQPSSTVQVLGAEDALFAHLRGDAPSPKHGLIYQHPAVRTAAASVRGRIARTLAGKLAIAARIDHYRGERDPAFIADVEATLADIQGGEAR